MNWKLKDILMIGIIGVLFSFVFLGAYYLGALLVAVLTPFGLGALGYEPIYGLWFMAAIVATYIIQKKGVGIVAEMIAALIEVLMGSMFGPLVFVTGFVPMAITCRPCRLSQQCWLFVSSVLLYSV